MWTIKLRVGREVEEIILSDEEYEVFDAERKAAKRSFDLLPLGRGRTCNKGDVIDTSKTVERDEVATTLMVWYGTYVWPNTNTLHGVQNWREFKTIQSERTAVELLIGEKQARGYITKAFDHLSEFPDEMREYFKRPTEIYKHFSEIRDYMNENILRKSDIIPEDFIKKFKVNF